MKKETDYLTSKGSLYVEFKNTEFYKDLREFLDKKILSCSDECVKRTEEEKYEEAKAYAHERRGYKSVIQYIEDCINGEVQAQEDADFQKDYESQIPRHV